MNVALLIDCENANPESIEGILGELAEKGAINISSSHLDKLDTRSRLGLRRRQIQPKPRAIVPNIAAASAMQSMASGPLKQVRARWT